MVFNSLVFIFLFLPIAFLVHVLIKNPKAKNIWLLVISLIFYAWGSPAGVLLLLLSIAWNYFTGLELEAETNEKKRKHILWFAVGVNILILGFFKYTNFLLGSILPNWTPLQIQLPLGLSFYTFSAISYIADVYMKKVPAQRSLLVVGLYISFFGKVSMGPIVQYNQIEEQILSRQITKQKVGDGLMMFIRGLTKKVIFADQFAIAYQALTSNTTMVGAWVLAIAYTFQLYFDFSGYSDMAIGIGKMFGFDMPANFDHPYVAVNAQDFWRRWHISLSTWFRDYVYIPLGGSRVETKVYIRNILIVWLLTGIWHGANWTFIFWGLYYAVILLLEKFYIRDWLKRFPKWVSHIYALLVIVIGWVFFMSPTIGAAFGTVGHLFGIGTTGFADHASEFILFTYFILFVFGGIFSTPILEKIQNKIFGSFKDAGIWMTIVLYGIVFVICLAFVVGSSYQMFLYSAF